MFCLLQLLQCCSSKTDYVKIKNKLYIYIYKYRSIFRVLKCLSRTATLQHCSTLVDTLCF